LGIASSHDGRLSGERLGLRAVFVAAGFVISGSRAPVEGLVKLGATWAALVLVIAYVGGALHLLSIVERKHLRGERKVYSGAIAGFVGGCAMLCVYLAAMSAFVLARLGAIDIAPQGKPGDLLPELLDGFLWYLFEMLPGLNVNEAIGWPKQMTLEGGGKGWILLGFRIVIVLCLFRLAARLLKEDTGGTATKV
jgi:hypothetical protein